MNEATGQVIGVWTRGRVFPLCTAVVLVGVVVALRLVSPYWFNALHLDVYLLIGIAVIAVAVAFGRKLTLTTEHVIMRQLTGTKRVHLSHVVLVVAARPGVLRPAFLQPVWVKLDTNGWRRSKALGWSKDDGMAAIRQAVRAIGGTLERDEPESARLGPGPRTDPGPVLEVWTKGRFLPLLTGLVAVALAGWAVGVTVLAAEIGFGVVAVLALLTAAGRKLTLTRNTLVVRKLLGLHRIVIPLDDVVSVRRRAASIGAPSAWQPVFVELTSGRTVSTKSLGAETGAGIAAIEQAVTSAGGRLETARP